MSSRRGPELSSAFQRIRAPVLPRIGVMADALPPLDAAWLQTQFDAIAAGFVKQLGLRIESAERGHVVLTLPVADGLVHGGGVLCGQAILAAADTAILLALLAQLGEFKPMTTVQLQASFLRPVAKGSPPLRVDSRILRSGKRLSYGEVGFATADGKLVAHATSTYSLL
ncbi:MAG: PaaI family thioesterase [Pseudomonadota bacterium]|nr:PaaI family thioesterase [Pseudomonadota bacterium]